MNEEIQLRDAHRAYAAQAKANLKRVDSALAIKEVWREGESQLTVYTKLKELGEIPSTAYQRAWHTEHPKARKLTQ